MCRRLSILHFRFTIYDLRFTIYDLARNQVQGAARGLPVRGIANRKSTIVNAVALLGVLMVSAPCGVQAAGTARAADSAPDLIQNAAGGAASEKWPDLAGKSQPELSAAVDRKSSMADEPIYVTVLSFIFKLAVVLALAYATICALKRFTGLRNVIGGSRRRIRIVENAALGTNRSLHLVEVERKRLLVGSTPSQINLLAELEAEVVPEAQAEPAEKASFSEQLSAFMGVGPDAGDSARTVAETIRGSSTFLQEKIMQLGRLRRKHRDA
jgi:flagellar biosynthetic protein FliO